MSSISEEKEKISPPPQELSVQQMFAQMIKSNADLANKMDVMAERMDQRL